jgi:tetratricopeptide (TPR) repeat protein
MPIRNFFVPGLSKEELVKNGMINAADTNRISTEMKWGYPKSTAYKTDLAVLNIIAAIANDGWKRPLYFDAGLRQGDYAGTGDYFHLEGDVYRLMPFKYTDEQNISQPIFGSINTDKGYDLFLNKFIWGGGERNDVYFDEPNRREFITYRMDASFLANALTAKGKKDSAIKVLDKVMNCITEHSYYYDFSAYYLAAAYYRAGAIPKAKDLTMKITRNCENYINWVATLSEDSRVATANDVRQQFQIMQSLSATAYQTADSATAKELYAKMQSLAPKVKELINTRSQQQQGAGEEEQ